MRILAANWEVLKELASECRTCYRGQSKEDILIDTFEHVSRDDRLKKATEEEIIEAFKKEFKQLHFRAVKNCLAERKTDGVDI